MIVYEGPGNLFQSQMQCITCPINTVGAMGKGLALTFRDHVPGLYEFYLGHFPKDPSLPRFPRHLRVFDVSPRKKVLLFPTKEHWRNPSRVDIIEPNLEYLARNYADLGIDSLAIPLIGCGVKTGQLDWETEVGPLVYQYLDPIELPVKIMTG